MLSHNCAQTPAVGAYIHARACATTHTHTYTTYTLVHAQLHTHKHACVICNSYGNTIRPAPPCPWFCPPPFPPHPLYAPNYDSLEPSMFAKDRGQEPV